MVIMCMHMYVDTLDTTARSLVQVARLLSLSLSLSLSLTPHSLPPPSLSPFLPLPCMHLLCMY